MCRIECTSGITGLLAYVKGKTGTVERAQSSFANPETRAYGADGLPEQRLYLVGVRAARPLARTTAGPPSDRLYVDVFEHWLEPAE